MSSTDGSKTQRLPRKPKADSHGEILSRLPPLGDLLAGGDSILAAMVDNLPVALFAKDADNDFRVVIWNKKQEAITTIPREKALGRTDFDMFSRESAEYFRQVDESVVRRGKPLDIPEEIISTGSAANEIWLHTTKAPVFDAVRKRTFVIGISEDITAQVRAREQLRELNTHLTLANQQLQETQMQLIQAEKMESVGRLAAGVAHEVKNPLALLLMGVEYLASGFNANDPNVPEILTEMRDAIDRADRIIRGLVDFSSNRQLCLEAHNLLPLVENALLLTRHEVRKGNINVEVIFEKDLPKVYVDMAKMEQVFVNLIINAVHAMTGRPRPNLEIYAYATRIPDVERDEGARTARHLRSGDEVVIMEFRDNGCGISDENMQKIFDPFFTTKATGVGTGLGLSVVRKIIELHRGRIALRNRASGGVAVSLTLKVAGSPGTEVDNPPAKSR